MNDFRLVNCLCIKVLYTRIHFPLRCVVFVRKHFSIDFRRSKPKFRNLFLMFRCSNQNYSIETVQFIDLKQMIEVQKVTGVRYLVTFGI